MKRFLVIAMLLLLSGCVDHIHEKQGAYINIIPVTYSFSINSENDEVIKNKLKQFIYKHDIENKKGYWEVTIYKDENETKKIKYQQLLDEFGFTINQIKMINVSKKPYFTVMFSFITQRIEYQSCGYEQVGYYGSNNIGCYTENNRWHSMVNPEKAI